MFSIIVCVIDLTECLIRNVAKKHKNAADLIVKRLILTVQ